LVNIVFAKEKITLTICSVPVPVTGTCSITIYIYTTCSIIFTWVVITWWNYNIEKKNLSSYYIKRIYKKQTEACPPQHLNTRRLNTNSNFYSYICCIM
jgi:hypothetical protein